MRIDRNSLAKFVLGPVQISLRGIEGAESRMRLCGTWLGTGGCSQFPLSVLHASFSQRENSKVVMRAEIFRSDCNEILEMLSCADVILFQKTDGSE